MIMVSNTDLTDFLFLRKGREEERDVSPLSRNVFDHQVPVPLTIKIKKFITISI